MFLAYDRIFTRLTTRRSHPRTDLRRSNCIPFRILTTHAHPFRRCSGLTTVCKVHVVPRFTMTFKLRSICVKRLAHLFLTC